MHRLDRLLCAIGVLSVLGMCLPSTAGATVIQFQATNMADAVFGEDLWAYEYTVGGRTFDTDQGFVIFFDPNLYGSLQDPVAGSDWDLLILQPDLALPDEGTYDALSLVNTASLTQPFSVSFVWLGPPGSTPGSQPFEVYQGSDPIGSVIETGHTTPQSGPAPIPEPSTLLLMGSGLAVVYRRHRRPRLAGARSVAG